ncbi:MAG: hypothetical protein E6Q99_10485 [Elusimicrobia bacterium]|nr:MAG: hypothetical protein E6Q99_10485 [Elusimicrobiota bacterium]
MLTFLHSSRLVIAASHLLLVVPAAQIELASLGLLRPMQTVAVSLTGTPPTAQASTFFVQ